MRARRILSLVLAMAMIIGVVPLGEIVAWAAPGDVKFTRITINKIYKNLTGAEEYTILITGNNFLFENKNRVEVGIMGDDGKIKDFTPTRSTNTTLQYELKPNQISGELYIDGHPIDISEGEMPTITNKTPTTGMVDGAKNAKVTLRGSGFENLEKVDSKIKGYLFQGNTDLELTNPKDDKNIESELLLGKTGDWNVRFEKITEKIDDLDDAKLIISHRYMGMFSMVNKLDVSEEIELIPTQGPVESTAFLRADALKPADEMSIFFLKDLTDPYLAKHMGTDQSDYRDDKLEKDIFNFKIPKALEIGSYYVVLTDKVDPTKDIKSQIKAYKVLDSKFIVIDGKSSVLIDSIDPPKGPAKGIDGTIKGQNIVRLSPNVYEGGTRGEIDISTNSNKMIVNYTGGKYKVIGDNGVDVKSLQREIRFLIGGEVTFRDGSKLDETVFDYVNVRVGENLDRNKLKHDITVEINTKIKYKENGEDKETEIFETHTLKHSVEKGFTYEPLDYQPEIKTIIPSKIPVDDNLEAMGGLEVSIIGENFSLYKYIDSNGKVQYKYPKFDFGGQFTLDPNKEDLEMQILDKEGNEIDGTEGNDLGTKILLTIPSGKVINKDILYNLLDFKLTNPIRVPESEDEGSFTTYPIQFVKPKEDETPTIASVTPSVIRIGDNNKVEKETVTISGRNFHRDVTVIVDGEEVNIKRINDTEIQFTSPDKKRGIYKITVQNPEGGTAFYKNFIYTQTLTNIKITDFNPKRGTKDMVVTMIGEEFKKPNPLVQDISGLGIYELIGTRILLGDKDINEYNEDSNDNIELRKYISAEDNKILKDDKGLKLSDYYHSVIMEHKDDQEVITRYSLRYNLDSQEIELLSGRGDKYILSIKDGNIIGKKSGQDHPITIETDCIKLDDKDLMFLTPYKIVGEEIVGNKVRVINEISRGELIFTIPNLGKREYYDVVARNPDMNEDSRMGQNGFYYEPSPATDPKIYSVDRNEGSVEGEYYVTIKGKNFSKGNPEEQIPKDKTSVFFGVQKVDPKDVRVLDDLETIIVKVPKYSGEIKKGKHSVVVSVLNSDNGGASLKDGFKYIKNTSKPRITGISPKEGSPSGGNVVIIKGEGFLFFEPHEGDIKDFKDLNNNDTWDDLRDDNVVETLKGKEDGWADLIVPILPEVYFGDVEGEVIGFDKRGVLEVKVPEGKPGTIDVKVMNNDSGWSNPVGYLYKGSTPKIEYINPDFSPIEGKKKITIDGERFERGAEVQIGNRTDPLISNSNIRRGEENYGEIGIGPIGVNLGDLNVEYEENNNKIKLTITAERIEKDKKVTYGPVEINYDDQGNEEKIFFHLEDLKNSEGESYPGYEKVRIYKKEIKDSKQFSRVVVDRGFSPEVTYITSRRITFKSPFHYDIEENVTLTLINPDGSQVDGKFNYRPQKSNLVIENIFKRLSEEEKEEGYLVEKGTPNERKIIELPYSGGIDLSILGKDFRKTAKVTFRPKTNNSTIPGKLNPEAIELRPENSLAGSEIIVKMGSLSEDIIGHEWIVDVIDEDGGSSGDSEDLEIPVYIKFVRSAGLKITSVTPSFGPAAGGTIVRIKGEGFKEILEGEDGNENIRVYFIKEEDGISREVLVPQSDIISVDTENIVLKTPAFTAGVADIKVVNLKDGRNDTLPNAFNYVSNPRITSVVHPENESFVIETISIEGGEKIKILGRDFMEGARVVFNPQLKLVEDDGQAVGDIITIDDKKYILESGVPGTEIERIDGQTITVTTPPGKLGEKGVIVINPDGGGTNIYNLVYGIPEIAAPFNVRAEVVFDQFIRVNWSGVSEANEYEIYMSVDGGKFEFIDTTELTSYAVQKLKPNTKYRFLVKAMGKYGTSKPIDESKSNEVTTGKEVGPIDVQGKPAEKTEIRKNGTRADIIVGSKDFTSKGMIIDLTKGDLAAIKDISIRIPASLVSDSTGKIQVLGKDYRMNFTPSVFKTSTIEANKSKSNAGVVFNIASHNDNMDLKAGESIVGGRYKLEAVTYVDKSLSKMDYINGSLNFILDQDPLIIKNRRLKNIKTVRYDDSSKTWVNINAENRLGLYTVIGSRR